MFDPDRPFTTGQAVAAGLTLREVRRDYQRVLGKVYLSRRISTDVLIRARAALLVHKSDAVLSHASVVRLLKAPVRVDPDEHVTVRDPDDRRYRHGVRCHVANLREQDLQQLGGLRVTCAERTFLDLSGTLPLVEVVVLGDWLVAKGFTAPDALVRYCRETPARYAARAGRAAAYVRSRVRSPQETRLRMLLVLAGLPEPTVNLEIRDDDGTLLLELDLAYELVRLAVEYDGRDHLESVRVWERDVERGDQLAAYRWRHLRVTSRGLVRDPEATVMRAWRALRELGYPRLTPPTDDWRPHFPG